MTDFFSHIYFYLYYLLTSQELVQILIRLFPMVLIIELPFYLMITSAILRYYFKRYYAPPIRVPYYPRVSCVITCYNEGHEIKKTVTSLVEQLYPGVIDIMIAIDPCPGDSKTLQAAYEVQQSYCHHDNRSIMVLAKANRGGHASSMNCGLALAQGEIVIAIDGDSSCDNDMIEQIVQQFMDKRVVGVSGTLRVRNVFQSLWTRLQALEYLFGIQLTRIGLGELNVINNISGAFGSFRRSFLAKIGGWNNGTAEDLDLTLRIQSYFRRYPVLRLVASPSAIVHTEVPASLFQLFKQRLQWDGDLYYIYFRRHWKSLTPKFLGWKAFLAMLWYGLLFQIIVPLVIVAYLIYMAFVFPISLLMAILIFTYFYYLIVQSIFFIIHIVLVSERRRLDCKLIPWIFMMPIYQLGMRIFSAFAIIYEFIMLGHKDTKMAPWWIIRKTK